MMNSINLLYYVHCLWPLLLGISGTLSFSAALTHDASNPAPLRLAPMLSSYMVLQREPYSARIWGWAAPGNNISITLNGNTTTVLLANGIVGDDGSWSISLPPQPAGAGYALQVTDGTTSLTMEDIAFGDVYLCAGQSNMEFTVDAALDSTKVMADSIHHANLRVATVNKALADHPMDSVGSRTPAYIWAKSSPMALNQSSMDGGAWGVYSATCYYFGLELYKGLASKIPIGLVTASWGGQRIETFSSKEALDDDTCGGLNPASFVSFPNQFQNGKNIATADGLGDSSRSVFAFHPQDSQIWNAMIHPLTSMRFVGVVWYQGEANVFNPSSYACRFPAMVADWRRYWGSDLTFVYVEVAALGDADSRGKDFPWLRAAQSIAQQLPKVGKVTAIDLGDPDSPHGPIHSRRKHEVGRRAALAMRAVHYKDPMAILTYTGPILAGVGLQINPVHSMAVVSFQPGTARNLHWAGTAACTTCCENPPFEILSPSRQWIRVNWMQIRHEDQVILMTNVSNIYGIRYAWEGQPECALYNGKGGADDHVGLPAAPFQWCAFSTGKPNWASDACEIPENTLLGHISRTDKDSKDSVERSVRKETESTKYVELSLPTFVDSHMVLQREPHKARIWGWAEPGANVTATIHDLAVVVSVAADADGKWIIDFPPQPASDGHSIEITDGTKIILLEDIAFGDVFLCSGQSNMEMTIGAVYDAQREIADAINYPNLRLATVAKTKSDIPMDDVKSATYYNWARSSPEAVTGNVSQTGWHSVFSATCYFFGRDLYQSMNGTIPIGLVVASWGGQKVETFSSADALADPTCGGTRPLHGNENSWYDEESIQMHHHRNKAVDVPDDVHPIQLWNAMIHPLVPMRFTAALWYQGEANSGNPTSYACRFPAMITDWRKKFNLPNLEFLFVQLAAFAPGSTWPWLRAAEGAALQLPGVGMATAIDLGETADAPNGAIHPRRKQEVGRRLSLVMRALHYRDLYAQYHYTGPVMTGVAITSSPTHSSLHLSFQPGTASELHWAGAATCTTCCDEPPFHVLEHDGTWKRVAKMEVVNMDQLALFTTAPEVFGIRYAWEPQPECVIYNGVGGPDDHSGLPAAPWEWCAFPSGQPYWTNVTCQVPDRFTIDSRIIDGIESVK